LDDHWHSFKQWQLDVAMNIRETQSSVETPTRCNFVIEFIIPKLFKG